LGRLRLLLPQLIQHLLDVDLRGAALVLQRIEALQRVKSLLRARLQSVQLCRQALPSEIDLRRLISALHPRMSKRKILKKRSDLRIHAPEVVEERAAGKTRRAAEHLWHSPIPAEPQHEADCLRKRAPGQQLPEAARTAEPEIAQVSALAEATMTADATEIAEPAEAAAPPKAGGSTEAS
jgi:hypothetical protein